MLEQALQELLGIFFTEATLTTYPVIFDTIKIVFLIFFLYFLFVGLASLARHKL